MGIFAGFFAAEIEVEIWIWGVGSIFYIISVVGGVPNSTHGITECYRYAHIHIKLYNRIII